MATAEGRSRPVTGPRGRPAVPASRPASGPGGRFTSGASGGPAIAGRRGADAAAARAARGPPPVSASLRPVAAAEGYGKLLYGFNAVLPEEYKIEVPDHLREQVRGQVNAEQQATRPRFPNTFPANTPPSDRSRAYGDWAQFADQLSGKIYYYYVKTGARSPTWPVDNVPVVGPPADDHGPSDDAPRRSGRTAPRSYTNWTDKDDASPAVAPKKPAAKKPARRRAAVSPGPAPKPKRKYKPRPEKPIPFLVKLVQLIRDEPDVISWTREGTIVIPDPAKLESKLPSYFRHQHYSSFQRQLNTFGFNKQHKSASPLNSVYVRVKGEQLANVDVVELLHLRPVLE